MAVSSWFSGSFTNMFPSSLAQAEQRIGNAGNNLVASVLGNQVVGANPMSPLHNSAVVQGHSAFANQIYEKIRQRAVSTGQNAGGAVQPVRAMNQGTSQNAIPNMTLPIQSPEMKQMFSQVLSTFNMLRAYFQQPAKGSSAVVTPSVQPMGSQPQVGTITGRGMQLGTAGIFQIDATIQQTLGNINRMFPLAKL